MTIENVGKRDGLFSRRKFTPAFGNRPSKLVGEGLDDGVIKAPRKCWVNFDVPFNEYLTACVLVGVYL